MSSLFPRPIPISPPATAPDLAPLSGYFCDDEHICVRDPGDFRELCPDSQCVARGLDGVIAPGSWDLASATVGFVGSAGPGMVVRLYSDLGGSSSPFGPDGDLLAVAAVGPGTLTLRRIGLGPGVGQPPAPSGAAGVEFSILTFLPQIDEATYDLMRRFNLDDRIWFDSTVEIYDLRVLRQACVLTVLWRMYSSESRADGDWQRKIDRCKADLDDALNRVNVRFGTRGFAEIPRGRSRARLTR